MTFALRVRPDAPFFSKTIKHLREIGLDDEYIENLLAEFVKRCVSVSVADEVQIRLPPPRGQ